MRKIIVFENVSLNGMMAGPKGEIDWFIRDPELESFVGKSRDVIDTFAFGRVTYDMMAKVWPTPAGQAASPQLANALNNTQKMVFSRTMHEPVWKPTEVIREIDKGKMLDLKKSPGGDIMIFGSQSIVNELARLGLIDEYQLLVNPIVMGKGLPLFDDGLQRLDLKLVKSTPFKSGIVLLQYQPKG